MEKNIEMLAFIILKEFGNAKTDQDLLHTIKKSAEQYERVSKAIREDNPPEWPKAKIIKSPF